jgi:glycosyltransferase involved in cell wall biosynthesis
MFEPARVVQALDSTVEVDVRADVDVEATRDAKNGLVTVSEVKEDVDLIIVQRPVSQGLNAMIEQAKKQGIAVIVEIDDDLERTHRNNLAWWQLQPQNSRNSNYEWLKRSIDLADALVCSTPKLQRFKPRGASFVLRNYVPESIFSIARMTPHTQLTVGWSGTLQTHPEDLQVTRGKVGEALQGSDTRFYVVGDGKGVQRALELPQDHPFEASGWTPLHEYYQRIIDNIDIGIVPLERSEFNEAKSYLKLLEFSALGIPTVASDTPENRYLSLVGAGVTASSPNDFKRHLERWIKNPERRGVQAAAFRDIVQENFTYEGHAHEWLDAWTQTVERRKAEK